MTLSKKKTIYLHVGTPKTGTTTIQMFLNQNKGVLKTQNIAVYTPCRTKDEDCPGRLRSLVDYLGLLDPALSLSSQKKKWFSRFLNDLFEEQADKIILSEECLWNVIGSVRKRLAFKKFLVDLFQFAEVRVVVYLRRQDNFIMSAYQQRLKGGGMNGLTCSQWIHRRDGDSRADYKKQLEWLLPLVGKENLTVRPFEKGQFLNGSLVEDFLRCIDLRLGDEYVLPPHNRNPGLAPFLAEIIRCLSFYYEDKDYVRPFLRLKKTGDIRYFNQDKDHRFLSPTERLRLIRRHEKGNRWIAQELLGRADGRLFYDLLPEASEAWEEFRLREIDVKEFFLTLPFLSENRRKIMSDQVIRVIRGRLSLWAKIKHEIVVLRKRLRLKHYSLLAGSPPCTQKNAKGCPEK